MTSSERQLEDELISKLKELKYVYRDDICDRAALEANFREKFQQLNRVKLTDEEFQRLLEEIFTPFLYHLSSLVELHEAQQSGTLYTHHFNMMRRVMEQTACFFGYAKWEECIKPEEDDPNGTVYKRVIDLMSHGDYSLYEPREMMQDNKEFLGRALRQFIKNHPFSTALFAEPNDKAQVA